MSQVQKYMLSIKFNITLKFRKKKKKTVMNAIIATGFMLAIVNSKFSDGMMPSTIIHGETIQLYKYNLKFITRYIVQFPQLSTSIIINQTIIL